MAEEKTDNTTKYLIAGGIALVFVWDKIFGKSEEEKKADKEEEKISLLPPEKNPLQESFKPTKPPAGRILFRTTKTVPAIPGDYLSKAATSIKFAIGKFTDDESAIISAMKRAATKTELNLIARTYAAVFKRDMWFDLKDNLNAGEMLPILQYVNKLPDSIPGTPAPKK